MHLQTTTPQLGLKPNWKQFTLLVLVNAFVGAMLGLERSIFPEFAQKGFFINSKTALLSFIVAFGIAKALSNYFAGKWANTMGRKKLLVIGWLFALPVPLILLYTGHWHWVVFANVLLGISQGLAWSSTVVMKIDLVGPKQRGLAMGINEFAGYFAIGIMAFVTGYLAQHYGLKPYPFYLAIAISIAGLALSILFVKDTRLFAHQEQKSSKQTALKNVFTATTFKNKILSSITQAGLVNNLNDGLIWGLLPVLLLGLKFNTQNIALIAATYPTVWGLSQLITGKLADVYPKKKLLFWGMLLQGLVLLCLPFVTGFYSLLALMAILGIGTALVYPTFLSAISVATLPSQRAESMGVFRLWRDLGYAIGAIVSGLLADIFGLSYAILGIALITVISAVVVQIRMPANLDEPSTSGQF